MNLKNIRRMSQVIFGLLGTGLTLLAVAPHAYGASLTGTGTWQSQGLNAKGTWTIDLIRTQDNIAGGLTLTGSPMASGANVSGTITNNGRLTFGVVENGAPVAKFTGTLQGTTISGTYTAENGDKGVWSGTLVTNP